MRTWTDSDSPRVKLLGFAAAVVPACILVALLLGPDLKLAGHRQKREADLAVLRENVYSAAWLDSTRAALSGEVETLRRIRQQVQREISPVQEVAAISDPLRREAQAAGCEVLRLSPSEDSADGLRQVRLRWETRADYSAALRFFRDLRLQHPEAYWDEVLMRTTESGSKLALDMTIAVHTRSGEAAP